jgi:predicted RNA-binding Zn-ribbon protein involved in translation (DUF1610 family)
MCISIFIRNQVKKHVEESAVGKECPDCGTVGRWKVGKVGIRNNYVSKTRYTPAKKDFEHPFDFAVPMICIQCGRVLIEIILASS